MTSIKVKFRPSTVVDKEGSIYYQIIHDRKTRQLLTDYKLLPSEWNDKRSQIVIAANSERRAILVSLRERIHWDVERLNKIVKRFEEKGIDFATEEIIAEFDRYSNEYSLFNFMESVIISLKQRGKTRTAETYKATLNSFKKFRNDEDIMLDAIDFELMENYEAHMKNKGIAPNTISFYMRILRATYNRAVEKEVIEQRNPFRHVYTGVDKTVKRALPLAIIKKIKSMDLELDKPMDYARDMFMLSFYLRGMSFIDMAYLRKSDLKDGFITYRRRKTDQQLVIEWTKEMQMILDKYPENPTQYLFPIIKSTTANERNQYRNAGYNINQALKKIAKKVGVNIPLTMYVARHSWASAAKSKGIPISVISEGMGHDSEATTQIYLASLDTSVVDKANSLILKALK